MGKQNVRAVQLGVTDVVANKYMCVRKLGEGGCGVIFELMSLEKPTDRFACKAELAGKNKDEEILKVESKVMNLMTGAGSKHSPNCLVEGNEKNYNYMIMTLLGPSLSDLRKSAKDQKFSLFTCMAVSIQALDSLKDLHNVGYLHRDVKPSNFITGLLGSPKERVLYLVDFGLARCYQVKNAEGKTKIRRKRKSAPFRGTVRYCSTNVHAQEEQGRHDDLISLMYMLLEMHLGELPWHNLDRENTEMCKTQSEQELLSKCPKEFDIVLQHLKGLNYGSVPKYESIRAMFTRVIVKKCKGGRKLDWEKGGEQEAVLRRGVLLEEGKDNGPTTEKIIALKENDVDEGDTINCGDSAHATTHSSADDTIELSQKSKSMPLKPQKKKSQANKYVYKGKASKRDEPTGVNSDA